MARIRSIKPEFWTSPQIVECSPTARLLFVGLWNFADDGGVTPAKAIQIKMRVFPGDPFSLEDVQGWLDELVDAGLLYHFQNNSQQYYAVTGWDKHQKIDKPSYRHPGPFDEGSTNVRGTVPERSPTTIPRKGVEGSGREGKGSITPGPSDDGPQDDPDDDFERLWTKRPRRAGNDPKHGARKAWNARMREKCDPQAIEAGLERYARFCEATGKIQTEKVMQFQTFLGPSRSWEQDWNLPKRSNSISDDNQQAIARAMGER